MPLETRENRRGHTEHYVMGRHLNLNDLKHEAQHLGNQYLHKRNIPRSPKPEFHVAHLKHDADPAGLRGIRTDEGFRVPHDGSDDPHEVPLLWWSLAVGPEEVKSAETRLLQQNLLDLTEDQAATHPSFLYKFTTSPAFSEKSRLGSYRFTFPLEEVLEAYRLQFCSGDQPVLRVYETVLHKQEVQHAVLVHSPANDELFSEYPLLANDPTDDAICVYQDGCFIWRPYAISETHWYELIGRPERNQMDAQECFRKQFYIWDNVAIALHVDQQVLKFDVDQLRKNLKFCDEGKAVIGTFDSFEEAKNQVKLLWPDCDSPLKEECSLEQHFTGNAQCCLQTAKVFNQKATIVDIPGLLSPSPGHPSSPTTLILGDSIIRDVRFFKAEIHSLPGATVSAIQKKLQDLLPSLPSSIKRVIIHVGGIDIDREQSEMTKRDFNLFFNFLKQCGKAVFISGPIPTLKCGDVRFSRTLSLHKWLRSVCREQGLGYIDNFDLFWKCEDFFARNGFHLNNNGSDELGANIQRAVRSGRCGTAGYCSYGFSY